MAPSSSMEHSPASNMRFKLLCFCSFVNLLYCDSIIDMRTNVVNRDNFSNYQNVFYCYGVGTIDLDKIMSILYPYSTNPSYAFAIQKFFDEARKLQPAPKQEGWDPKLDATCQAPLSHEVVFENERIRLLKVTIDPFTKEPFHIHGRNSVMLVLEPTRIKYYNEKGEASEFNSSVGTWVLEPEKMHAVENLDAIPYAALRLEIK